MQIFYKALGSVLLSGVLATGIGCDGADEEEAHFNVDNPPEVGVDTPGVGLDDDEAANRAVRIRRPGAPVSDSPGADVDVDVSGRRGIEVKIDNDNNEGGDL